MTTKTTSEVAKSALAIRVNEFTVASAITDEMNRWTVDTRVVLLAAVETFRRKEFA